MTIVVVMGILIDLGRAGDLPHLVHSRYEIVASRAACETFLDSAARVFLHVQSMAGFRHRLQVVLSEGECMKVFTSPVSEILYMGMGSRFTAVLFRVHSRSSNTRYSGMRLKIEMNAMQREKGLGPVLPRLNEVRMQ